jgi:hypothetical protein
MHPLIPELSQSHSGAFDRDGLKRKLIPATGHIAAAPLAGDDEGLAARWSREHENIIGEHEANIFTEESPKPPQPQIAWKNVLKTEALRRLV